MLKPNPYAPNLGHMPERNRSSWRIVCGLIFSAGAVVSTLSSMFVLNQELQIILTERQFFLSKIGRYSISNTHVAVVLAAISLFCIAVLFKLHAMRRREIKQFANEDGN